MNRMLELRRLRLLFELERRGTMAAVARAVGASPSAVSQQLALLEAEVGVRLLEPVGRGVQLTLPARRLAEHAGVALERLEEAEAELASAGEAVGGRLRVAVFHSVLSTLVPATLAHLAVRHPGLRIEMSDQDPVVALEGLRGHDFDLMLGEELPGLPLARDPAVHEEDLALDPIWLALPRQGAWADVPPRLSAAAGIPWVMERPGTDATVWATAQCRAAGFEPDVRFDTSDTGLHVQLVEAGQAAAFIPDLLRRRRRYKVRWVRPTGRPARRLFTAVRARSAAHPGLVALRASFRHALRG